MIGRTNAGAAGASFDIEKLLATADERGVITVLTTLVDDNKEYIVTSDNEQIGVTLEMQIL